MARNPKVAIEVEIKNIKQIADLKKELKELRKAQKDQEAESKSGRLQSHKNAKAYKERAKAIKENSKQLRTLNKDMAGATKSTKNITKSNNGMAKQFIKGAAAIGVIVGAFRAVNRVVSSVITTFTDFEFVMSKVNAVSGATEREFAALNKTAEELGRTTFFTATQVGELMLNFSKLGFTANEIQAAVQPTLDLATATGSDLARAALVAGAAVRGFGLDASETQRVVDVMAVSFSSSAMNIEKWQTSMTKVAPIAKSAGFSIEDTAAIMSKLTDSGIEASIAGTSLRNILLKMQDPSSDLTKAFGGTIHSLDQLVPAMKKFITEGGSMADVMEVVDLRQAAAFEQMLTTADGTLELRDALLAAGGEGARMAGIVGDTLQGAFLKFSSALQGVSISLMKNYTGGLQKSIEKMAQWLNNLTDNIDGVVRLLSWTKRIVTGLLAYKLGVIALTVATKAFTKATYKSIVSVKSFTKALSRTGVGLLVIALGDLIYSLATFNEEAREATDWTGKLSEGIDKEEKSVGALEVSLNRLVEAKKHIDKYSKDEVEQLDKASYEYKIYAKNLIVATQETNTLNQAFKDNGQELITLQTDISDTQEKFADLARQMRNTAAVSVASQMSADIIQTKMEVDNLMSDLKTTISETLGRDVGEATILDLMQDVANDNSFESWLGGVLAALNDLTGGSESAFVSVKRAIEESSVSVGDFIKYAEKGQWYHGEQTGIAMMNKDLDAINQELKELFPNFEDFVKIVGDDAAKATGKLVEETADLVEEFDDLDKSFISDVTREAYVGLMNEVLNGNMTLKDSEKELFDFRLDLLDNLLKDESLSHDAKMKLEEMRINMILKNAKKEEDVDKKRLKSLKKEIKNYSDLGSALQTVAGDNESLNFIKEAGIKITRAAAVAESILNIQKAIAVVTEGELTVAKLLGTQATLGSVTATISETVAETLAIVPKAINAILNQGSGDPYSSFFRMIAMVALVGKVMNMFEDGGIIDDGKKFAKGGMVHGPSHAQGGVKFAVGGRVNELEGGEAVINKRSTAMFRGQLSAMNEAGGGVKFADGGLLNSPAFAQQQFSGNMGGGGGAQKVYVVEADISQSQNQVSVLEASATI